MSGAEVAGLAIGVAALASAFTTCVDFLEYFELGRNYFYDYDIACTKINLLHKRLSIWGCDTRIQHLNDEHPSLRDPTKRDVIAASLLRLSAILTNTELLRQKYDLRPVTHAKLEFPRPSNPHCKGHRHWPLHLRKRTTWSIRDKAKFDSFIADVSFLLDNMERITGPDSAQAKAMELLKETFETLDPSIKALLQSAGGKALREQALAVRPPAWKGQDAARDGAATDGEAGDSSNETPASDGSANELSGFVQKNDSAVWAFQGLMDPAGKVALRDLTQVNSGNTTAGFQGAGPSDAVLRMQQAAYEQMRFEMLNRK